MYICAQKCISGCTSTEGRASQIQSQKINTDQVQKQVHIQAKHISSSGANAHTS